jgi:ribonuclease Z
MLRRVLSAALILIGGMLSPAVADQPQMKVTLLGTGSPVPLPDRFGPSTLVQAGRHNLLFDAGRGLTIRLYQIGVSMSTVDPLFITHYHSDHVNGLPDLWLTGWLGAPWAKRTSPLHVIGPTGLKELTSNLEKAYAADIRIRIADERYPPEGVRIEPQEFGNDGVVYDNDGVKVTAFEVNHGDEIKPAYGYRVDFAGHSVVLSGDTRFNENLIKHATGADLIIHEVAAAPPQLASDKQVQTVMAHHTSPQEAGTVFSRTHPKLAVFSHIVLSARPNVPALTMEQVVEQTRQTYSGPLQGGEDLMSFDIADQVSIWPRR